MFNKVLAVKASGWFFFHTRLFPPNPQLYGGVSAGGLSLLAFHPPRETCILAIHHHPTLASGLEGGLPLSQCDSPPPLGPNPGKGGAPAPCSYFPLGGEVGLLREGEGGRARALPFQMQPETKGN